MDDSNEFYKMIEEQERLLQFTEFTSETALTLGMMMINRAKKENKKVTIDITRYNQKLFFYASNGSRPNAEYVIEGKKRLVNRYYHSSAYITRKIKENQMRVEKDMEFNIGGGSFPIIIKNVGVIGTITLSGLDKDHDYIVDAITEYLGLSV